MDAASFATFLKKTLQEKAKEFDQNLLSVNYDNISDAKRYGGIRDALMGFSDSMDNLLKAFYNQKGNPLPEEK